MAPALVSAPFRTHDPAFAEVTGEAPRLELVGEVDAHEGPVHVAEDDALYFTSLPRPRPDRSREVAIRRLTLGDGRVETVVADANAANGMALAPDGRLVVCEQGGPESPAAITLVDRRTGERDLLVDSFRGLPLNSPNDVVIAPDGAVWFTDPSYGHLQGFRPPPALGDHVYRHDPATGRTEVVSDAFDKPNGIAFAPGATTLYVSDSGANHEEGSYDPARPHHVLAFDVDGGRLAAPRLLAVTVPGFPDGLKTDCAGRVYASAFSGVQVFAADGRLLGEIELPGAVNFAWGGPHRGVLYITTDTAVWAAVLATQGA